MRFTSLFGCLHKGLRRQHDRRAERRQRRGLVLRPPEGEAHRPGEEPGQRGGGPQCLTPSVLKSGAALRGLRFRVEFLDLVSPPLPRVQGASPPAGHDRRGQFHARQEAGRRAEAREGDSERCRSGRSGRSRKAIAASPAYLRKHHETLKNTGFPHFSVKHQNAPKRPEKCAPGSTYYRLEHRRQEEAGQGHADHAGEDHRTQGVPPLGPRRRRGWFSVSSRPRPARRSRRDREAHD